MNELELHIHFNTTIPLNYLKTRLTSYINSFINEFEWVGIPDVSLENK